MGRLAGRFVRSRAGASAVEFSLVVVPLLLLVFGIIEYGGDVHARRLGADRDRERPLHGHDAIGLRDGRVYDPALSANFVKNQALTWSIPLTTANITLNQAGTCGGIVGFSTVSLTYTFQTAVPKFITALAGGAVLSATACFPNHT